MKALIGMLNWNGMETTQTWQFAVDRQDSSDNILAHNNRYEIYALPKGSKIHIYNPQILHLFNTTGIVCMDKSQVETVILRV